jgi:hypothetical protein
MLKIRREQMEAFEHAALRGFEDEMVDHGTQFSPDLCRVLGDEQVHTAVRSAIERSSGYGFTYRGPIRLFVELMFLFGSRFDTDPQYPAFGQVLNKPAGQMERAEQMHERAGDYAQNVAGPNNVNARKALEALSALARRPVVSSSNDAVTTLLSEWTRVFPEKVAYVGEEQLTVLIQEGRTEALKNGLDSARGEALMGTLMFMFGHGCAGDPLYPWISRTLKDERVPDPAARAERLERKAVTWLDHVLARRVEGGQP